MFASCPRPPRGWRKTASDEDRSLSFVVSQFHKESQLLLGWPAYTERHRYFPHPPGLPTRGVRMRVQQTRVSGVPREHDTAMDCHRRGPRIPFSLVSEYTGELWRRPRWLRNPTYVGACVRIPSAAGSPPPRVVSGDTYRQSGQPVDTSWGHHSRHCRPDAWYYTRKPWDHL